jgi:SAM-dependent methyltransferase
MMALKSRYDKLNRKFGLLLERLFWKRCIASGGKKHTDWYRTALQTDKPLSPFHRQFIDNLPGKHIRILEVGAGPMTVLGSNHPSKVISIVATDLLAAYYETLLAKKGITPPVKTVWADAESLSQTFPLRSFDYVTANNCIDHCENPIGAIHEMLSVVKAGHFVSLRHRENEGQREKYLGLHKWNFGFHQGTPILCNKNHRYDLSELAKIWGSMSVFPEKEHVVLAFKREVESEPTTIPSP